jgi:hypothetical protein
VYISAMIQPVPKSKKEQKSISRKVNLGISSPPATIEYLRWSDQTIRFSREDHPRKVPRPGHTPMVLKAPIGGYDIGRVYMDAGSGINLIYVRTLMTHKYRGSQQSSREVKLKFIDSTQGEPKNIYKP